MGSFSITVIAFFPLDFRMCFLVLFSYCSSSRYSFTLASNASKVSTDKDQSFALSAPIFVTSSYSFALLTALNPRNANLCREFPSDVLTGSSSSSSSSELLLKAF